MRPFHVVLSHHDSLLSRRLAGRLRPEFRGISVANSVEETRQVIVQWRPAFAIVDLELIGYSELSELCSNFPTTAFVGIHRLADEKVWCDALAAGAVDCCAASDIYSILRAADRWAPSRAALAVAA